MRPRDLLTLVGIILLFLGLGMVGRFAGGTTLMGMMFIGIGILLIVGSSIKLRS